MTNDSLAIALTVAELTGFVAVVATLYFTGTIPKIGRPGL